MSACKRFWQGRRNDERGATLVVVAIAMAILMPTALAFSVELGEVTDVNRSLQSAADAGALDAARYITVDPTLVTKYGDIGVTNNYANATPSVQEGTWSSATGFSPSSSCTTTTCNAVRVTATSKVKHISKSGYNNLSRYADAVVNPGNSTFNPNNPAAGLSIGTYLASFSSGSVQIPVLNSLLSSIGNVNLTAVGYNGLASTSVTVQQLIDASAGVLTPSNVLSASSPALLPAAEWEAILDKAVDAQATALGCPDSISPVCAASVSLDQLTPATPGTCNAPSGTAPTVTNVSTKIGSTAGGTSTTITGTGFTGVNSVSFGTTPATSFTVNSSTSITAVSPAGSTGTVDVTVATSGGNSATSTFDQFTYVALPPTISSIAPVAGPVAGGTTVVISGANLTSASVVDFGSTPATSFTVNSSTSITAVSPAGGAGTVDVTVATAGGLSTTVPADDFTYTAAPTVTSISPTVGVPGGGTSVTITGSNLSNATAVKFGATVGSVTVDTATSITVTSPAGSAGVVDVTVTTAGGTSVTSAGDKFTYAAVPVVTSISPTAGPLAGGTSVTITGSNLSGATAVKFGTTAGTVTVDTATSITVTSPAGSTGVVDVKVTTVGGTSATSAGDKFTYTPAPTITSISPTSGSVAGLTTVTINGTNFVSGATTVSFGTAGAAASTTFVSSSQLKAVSPIPVGLLLTLGGTVNITATTAGGTSAISSADQYAYKLLGGLFRTVGQTTTSQGITSQTVGSAETASLVDQTSVHHHGDAAAPLVRLVDTNASSAPTYQLTGFYQSSASACVSFCQLVSINGSSCATNSLSPSALSAKLNGLGLLTTDAELANGQNALNITSALNIPGLAAASLVTTLIQPAQYAYGQAPATLASAAQVGSACTNRTLLSGQTYACTSQVNIDLQLSIAGLATIDIPLSAASGWAALSTVSCTNNLMTRTQIQAATTAASTDVTATVLAGLLGGATLDVANLSIGASSPTTLTFNPPTPSSQNIPGNSLTLTTKGILGLLSPVIGTVLNAVTADLTPLLQALGVSVGGADVSDLSTTCAAVEMIP